MLKNWLWIDHIALHPRSDVLAGEKLIGSLQYCLKLTNLYYVPKIKVLKYRPLISKKSTIFCSKRDLIAICFIIQTERNVHFQKRRSPKRFYVLLVDVLNKAVASTLPSDGERRVLN